MSRFKWYRKWRGGRWYKHENTYQLPGLLFTSFWARYGEINRYTKVVDIEDFPPRKKRLKH